MHAVYRRFTAYMNHRSDMNKCIAKHGFFSRGLCAYIQYWSYHLILLSKWSLYGILDLFMQLIWPFTLQLCWTCEEGHWNIYHWWHATEHWLSSFGGIDSWGRWTLKPIVLMDLMMVGESILIVHLCSFNQLWLAANCNWLLLSLTLSLSHSLYLTLYLCGSQSQITRIDLWQIAFLCRINATHADRNVSHIYHQMTILPSPWNNSFESQPPFLILLCTCSVSD